MRDWRRRGVFGVAALYAVGAWVVLQVADLAFPGWDIPESAIRYVWLGALLLSPVALIIGWRYDVSLEGIRRTATTGGDPRDMQRTDWVLLGVLGSLCAIVLAGVLLKVLDVREPGYPGIAALEAPDHSIAVLPFADLSGEPGNEYFGDGITEQLLNELSRIRGLQVAARTSSFYYKGRNEPMTEIGRALGVRSLLEGSVRKVGDTVRVTAQLIDAETGYHLWSQTWDRRLDDIFAVQDEIAQRITRTLEVRLQDEGLAAIDRGGTLSAAAYDLYLRAVAERYETSDGAVARSNALLEQAIDIDPEFALALDALAYGYLLQVWSGERERGTAMEQAAELLTRALEQEPELEQAHASLGLLASMAGEFEEANARHERALEINPNYFGAQVNYGLSLVHQSRLKDASAAYYRALALDRMNGNLAFNLGSLLMLQGQFADGRDMLERSLTIQPERADVRAALTHWPGQYGELAAAVHNGRSTFADHPDNARNIGALAHAYRLLGLEDDAAALLDEAAAAGTANLDLGRMEHAFATGDGLAYAALARRHFEQLDLSRGDPLNTGDQAVARRYGLALLLQNEDTEAASVLHWAAGGDEGIQRTTYDFMGTLKLLALGWQRSGREDDARVLIDQCLELTLTARESGWATPVLSVRLAEIHLLNDDKEAAIAELNLAVEKGFRDVGWIENQPFWRLLDGDPRIEASTVAMLDAVETERQAMTMLK